MHNIPIRIRFSIILTLVFIAIFLIISVVNYKVSKDNIRNDILNNALPLTRDNIYSEIQTDLMRPIFISSLMANDTFLRDWAIKGENNSEEVVKYLYEIITEYGFFTSFYVSAHTNKYYHFKGILKEISPSDKKDNWYYDFIQKQKRYDLNIDVNSAAKDALTIFINHRVMDYNNNLIGVTGVGLDLQRISNLIRAFQVKYDRDVYLIDKEGNVKLHPDSTLIEQANIHKMPGIRTHASDILQVSQVPSFFEYQTEVDTILLTVRYIPEMDWFLMVEQRQGKAMTDVTKNLYQNIFFGILITISVLIINILLINFFQRKLEISAATDELTNTYNRKFVDIGFESAVSRFTRNDEKFSVLLIDIDNFKMINDTFGHLTGDSVLIQVAAIIKHHIRPHDVLIRWGGDEFLIICYCPLQEASMVAERIRTSVEKEIPVEKPNVVSSISCGITEYLENDTIETITHRADNNLYTAKENGRNQIFSI